MRAAPYLSCCIPNCAAACGQGTPRAPMHARDSIWHVDCKATNQLLFGARREAALALRQLQDAVDSDHPALEQARALLH